MRCDVEYSGEDDMSAILPFDSRVTQLKVAECPYKGVDLIPTKHAHFPHMKSGQFERLIKLIDFVLTKEGVSGFWTAIPDKRTPYISILTGTSHSRTWMHHPSFELQKGLYAWT